LDDGYSRHRTVIEERPLAQQFSPQVCVEEFPPRVEVVPHLRQPSTRLIDLIFPTEKPSVCALSCYQKRKGGRDDGMQFFYRYYLLSSPRLPEKFAYRPFWSDH